MITRISILSIPKWQTKYDKIFIYYDKYFEYSLLPIVITLERRKRIE
jgi:hypothetical protein